MVALIMAHRQLGSMRLVSRRGLPPNDQPPRAPCSGPGVSAYTLEHEFLPEAHSIASLDRDRIRALASSLPATDDDEFMSELQGCDPLEETIDVYISDEVHRE